MKFLLNVLFVTASHLEKNLFDGQNSYFYQSSLSKLHHLSPAQKSLIWLNVAVEEHCTAGHYHTLFNFQPSEMTKIYQAVLIDRERRALPNLHFCFWWTWERLAVDETQDGGVGCRGVEDSSSVVHNIRESERLAWTKQQGRNRPVALWWKQSEGLPAQRETLACEARSVYLCVSWPTQLIEIVKTQM